MNGNDSRLYTGYNLRPPVPYPHPQPYNPLPRVPEDILATKSLKLERKEFQITLRQNERGKFIRIVEDNRGRFNCVIVPEDGLEAFRDAVNELADAAKKIKPAKK